jgi:hypothetical protein
MRLIQRTPMTESDETEDQLIRELTELRRRVSGSEAIAQALLEAPADLLAVR